VFEVGRRFKIMNPDKLRSEYGKLMYLLMDSADSHVQDLLEFKWVAGQGAGAATSSRQQPRGGAAGLAAGMRGA
jgi:hypothetical protein